MPLSRSRPDVLINGKSMPTTIARKGGSRQLCACTAKKMAAKMSGRTAMKMTVLPTTLPGHHKSLTINLELVLAYLLTLRK